MNLISFFDNDKVVTSVAAFGFFQNFFDYANPIIQFLIALCTLSYVYKKQKNHK